MRISDWSSDVCSSDLHLQRLRDPAPEPGALHPLHLQPVGHVGRDAEMREQRIGLEHHVDRPPVRPDARSEEHTSELQSLMRISYAVFCLKQKKIQVSTQVYRF